MIDDVADEVLKILKGNSMSGRDIRTELDLRGKTISLASFYHLMSRLEDDGRVFSWDVPVTVGKHIVYQRHYRITDA